MPTYGYHCPTCQSEFEVFRRMTDEEAVDCPSCGTPGRRLFFPAGIVFKGSGFYKTDSRGGSGASGGGSTATTPAAEKPKSDGTAAAAPAKSGEAPTKSGEATAGGATATPAG